MWIFTCNWVLLVACFTSVLDYFFPLCYTQPGVLHVSPPVGLLFWSSFKGLYISVCWGIHLDILILYHQNHLHCLLSLSLPVTVCLCLSARSDAVGVFVKHVVPGSAADQSGNIRIHDRLIAVRTCCLIRVVPAGLLFLSVPSWYLYLSFFTVGWCQSSRSDQSGGSGGDEEDGSDCRPLCSPEETQRPGEIPG